MTEKRFYYNTFYHADNMSRVLEYEIIDRQSYPNYPNHDEKEDIPNWCIYIGENDSGWQDMLVQLLNALHEENEKLKSDLKDCRKLKTKRLNKIRNHRAVIEDLGESIRAYKGKIEQTNEKIDKIKEAMEDTGALTKRQLEEILNG